MCNKLQYIIQFELIIKADQQTRTIAGNQLMIRLMR